MAPFVVGLTPPPPFPARCSPWQPCLPTRGAKQQPKHLVWGNQGAEGKWDWAGDPVPWQNTGPGLGVSPGPRPTVLGVTKVTSPTPRWLWGPGREEARGKDPAHGGAP